MKKSAAYEDFVVFPTFDEDGVQASSGIGRDGREYPDPVPMAPSVGIRPPESMSDLVLRVMQQEEFKRLVDVQGFDTPEEADDFDIEDDPVDPATPWEEHFMPRIEPGVGAGASNGGPQAAAAPQPEVNQKASSGLASVSLEDLKAEMQRRVGAAADSGKADQSQDSPSSVRK